MTLSKRAWEAAEPSELTVEYEVLGNIWSEDNPSGYVNLGVAENTLMHDTLLEYIEEEREKHPLSSEQMNYQSSAAGPEDLREGMATLFNRYFNPHEGIHRDHITVTNGCSAAVEHLAWAYSNPGEMFLLGQPYYGSFVADITMRTGALVELVPFGGLDPLGVAAVDSYEEVLLLAAQRGAKAAGIIICNPHNPLGRCYSAEFIAKMMLLCQKWRIQLISDEIYGLSTWTNDVDPECPSTPFCSALSVQPPPGVKPSRVSVIWGMSKDFGANGIRIGAIISQRDPKLHRALAPLSLYSMPSSVACHMSNLILRQSEWLDSYIAANRWALKKHHELMVNWARGNNITYKEGVNAALFVWVDLGSAYLSHRLGQIFEDVDEAVSQALLSKKVFLASGTSFGSEQSGWFRIVFSNHRHVLEEGLRRILEAVRPWRQAA